MKKSPLNGPYRILINMPLEEHTLYVHYMKDTKDMGQPKRYEILNDIKKKFLSFISELRGTEEPSHWSAYTNYITDENINRFVNAF